jgi:hypothetical protein
MQILGAVVDELTATSDGVLRLQTQRGTIKIVPPGEYEAWELDGEDSTLSVFAVGAGGSLAVWETARAKP